MPRKTGKYSLTLAQYFCPFTPKHLQALRCRNTASSCMTLPPSHHCDLLTQEGLLSHHRRAAVINEQLVISDPMTPAGRQIYRPLSKSV